MEISNLVQVSATLSGFINKITDKLYCRNDPYRDEVQGQLDNAVRTISNLKDALAAEADINNRYPVSTDTPDSEREYRAKKRMRAKLRTGYELRDFIIETDESPYRKTFALPVEFIFVPHEKWSLGFFLNENRGMVWQGDHWERFLLPDDY